MSESTDNLEKYLYLYVVNSKSDPTQDELEEAIRTIAQNFPHIEPFFILEGLYGKLSQLKRDEAASREEVAGRFIGRSYDYHNFLKKMIAKSFYFLGYGYERFIHFMIRQHASFHIDKKTYVVFCEGVVLQLYRSLERMMIKNGERIKLKHKNRVKELNEWVLNHRKYLNENQSHLLRRFICRRYDIAEVVFTFDDAKRLYDTLEKRYDTGEGMDTEELEECLNNIELNSTSGLQLNFSDLLNDCNDFNAKASPSNKINQEQAFPFQHFLYQDQDLGQLNFDLASNEQSPYLQ